MTIYDETLNKDSVSIQSDEYGMRAYVNSIQGRSQLETECSTDVVSDIYKVWGNTATITETVKTQNIDEVKQVKLQEIANALQTDLAIGIEIVDTKGTECFSMTLDDQFDIKLSYDSVMSGEPSAPYHANGQGCRRFTADEIKAIYIKAMNYITPKRTLCNYLNVWIKRCTSVDDVQAITWNSKLPNDLLAGYNAALGITN